MAFVAALGVVNATRLPGRFLAGAFDEEASSWLFRLVILSTLTLVRSKRVLM